MATPSAATHRYSREYLQIGPVARLYNEDDNPDEVGLTGGALTPPFCRFAPTLMLFFKDEERVLDASNSFAQGGGGVSSYSWSGGGSGSTQAYTLSTAGTLNTITCTITDGNGVSTTGIRWAFCCNRPGVGPTVDQAITSFKRGPIRGTVGERGWTGCTVDVEILDASLIDAFAMHQFIVIYREEYEKTGAGPYALQASGEVFCGVIAQMRKQVRKAQSTLSFTAETIETLFQSRQGRSVDTDDHVFLNAATSLANEVTDPLVPAPVTGPTPASNAIVIPESHKPALLTVGWVQSHLLNWHTSIDVDGTKYRFPQVVDLVSDWWNLLGGAAAAELTHLNVPAKPLKSAIEDMLSDYLGVMYCDELGRVNNTVHHAGKGSPDGTVDSIDATLAYELDPMGDNEPVVRQVVVTQSTQAKSTLTTPVLKGVYPASPAGDGSLMQVQAWATTQAALDAIAQAYYRHANANGRIRAKLPGTTFGQFNKFTALGDTYWVESNSIDRPNADRSGGLVQEIIGRRVA